MSIAAARSHASTAITWMSRRCWFVGAGQRQWWHSIPSTPGDLTHPRYDIHPDTHHIATTTSTHDVDMGHRRQPRLRASPHTQGTTPYQRSVVCARPGVTLIDISEDAQHATLQGEFMKREAELEEVKAQLNDAIIKVRLAFIPSPASRDGIFAPSSFVKMRTATLNLKPPSESATKIYQENS